MSGFTSKSSLNLKYFQWPALGYSVALAMNDNLEKSIAQRAVRGSLWMFGGKIIHRGLGLLRIFILARLLSPDDFGLFGLALLTLNLVDNFSVTGITNALIQKRENVS